MPITSASGLVEALREARVLSPGQLDEVTRTLQAQFTDSRALAGELLGRGWLSAYQVNQLLQGRGAELVLGPYMLLERLGEGGMGQVFKARHQIMDRVVALKVIRKERLAHPDAVDRFHREIRLAAQLDHPHLVRAHDASQVGDTHFLVMEFAEGSDLQRLVRKSGPLPVPLACGYVRQAALGLQHAAERGLVHRDIKPSNLQVTAQGTVVKILDMGLARSQTPEGAAAGVPDLTQTQTVLGTPDYIAPEQIADPRRVDTRADIYSLGCTFYFMLAGRPPFPDGAWEEKLVCHRKVEPQPIEQLRPDVPAALGAILRKMMAKRPEDRYPTPAAVADALAPFCQVTVPLPPVAGIVPLPSTIALPGAPGTVAGIPQAGAATPSGHEPGWTLVANSTICPPAAPLTQMQPAVVPTPASHPGAASPARSVPQGHQPPWLIWVGVGAGAALLLVLVIVFWPRGGPDRTPTDLRVEGGKGGDGTKGKGDDGNGTPDKNKGQAPPKLTAEDFRTALDKGDALPHGWKGKSYSVTEGKNGKACLEVTQKLGEHMVAPPSITLAGDFAIEAEYILGYHHNRFLIQLEGRKGEPPLTVVITSTGAVTINDNQPRPEAYGAYDKLTKARLLRKGGTLTVFINGKRAAVGQIKPSAEYSGLQLSLPAGVSYSQLAQLYSLKVEKLDP
jgi:serine/threonine-protein kinase